MRGESGENRGRKGGKREESSKGSFLKQLEKTERKEWAEDDRDFLQRNRPTVLKIREMGKAWHGDALLRGRKAGRRRHINSIDSQSGPLVATEIRGRLVLSRARGGGASVRPESVEMKGSYGLKIYILNLEITIYF